MNVLIRYYHVDGGDTLESIVSMEAYEVFISVLLKSGYRILSVV